ncbi:NAD(P)H-binding protein [Lactiplantibacillus pentosus]|uniref:Oxidoreductase n=2 Tax=Lactiplantibacillus pentosus TaxID=1589 RepID=A0ABD7IUA2_LACPE|nr:NAD(P)H-binding protein [Lactiplantibacillus pentosus]MCA1344065.1 NAD(P)H-binding protein [Lactiplantibacillus pentosus]MCJ8185976.1 NAD(P)H-binding protein [Lactiplantibacillus pentosus]MCT3303973.1 oxidoreductase [Lactiplantibacillus pentosus]MCT3310251.1 oxidoreductase [Lactiplantibacillus pentosus]PRO77954.1 oxidoreductase [Lactiplantibacillus pentosus]
MTKNILIMAANGQISRLVEERVLNEAQFADVHLTLFLRNKDRLANLANNPRVTLIEGSLDSAADIKVAVAGQDIVFVGVVDHTADNHQTQNIVAAMKAAGVQHLIYTNVLGIYDEVPGAFGEWNKQMIGSGLPSALRSDQIMAESGLDYTTLRLPWLNDREVKYEITHKNDQYLGVSGSRKSIADVVLRIIAEPSFLKNDSVGIADPDTQGENRPVY